MESVSIYFQEALNQMDLDAFWGLRTTQAQPLLYRTEQKIFFLFFINHPFLDQ